MSVRRPGITVTMLVVALIVVGAGTVLGVGPLAGSAPASSITDPSEVLARSLQAVLDANAVELDATLSGSVPAQLIGQPGHGAVSLDGTTIQADIRPKDGKTRAHLESDSLGIGLDTVTVWDSAYSRAAGAPLWTRTSLGEASASAGLDINPLTLVDRLRSYLATPGISPTLRTVGCTGGGVCREVKVSVGSDPLSVVAGLLPPEHGALGDVSLRVTLESAIETLRPQRMVIEGESSDGTVRFVLEVRTSRWDEDLVIDEPAAADVEPA